MTLEGPRRPPGWSQPPLETWVSGPMPRHRGETIYVFRTAVREICDDVDELRNARHALPWYFTLSSAGASLALTGLLGLLAYSGAGKDAKPAHWLVYAYGAMLLVGGTAAVIFFIVGLIGRSSFSNQVQAIGDKIRDLEYEAPQQSGKE